MKKRENWISLTNQNKRPTKFEWCYKPCGAIASSAFERCHTVTCRIFRRRHDYTISSTRSIARYVIVASAHAQSRHAVSIHISQGIDRSTPGTGITTQRAIIAIAPWHFRVGWRWCRRRCKAITVTTITQTAPLVRIQNAIGQWHLPKDRLRPVYLHNMTLNRHSLNISIDWLIRNLKYGVIFVIIILLIDAADRAHTQEREISMSIVYSLRSHAATFKHTSLCSNLCSLSRTACDIKPVIQCNYCYFWSVTGQAKHTC